MDILKIMEFLKRENYHFKKMVFREHSKNIRFHTYKKHSFNMEFSYWTTSTLHGYTVGFKRARS